jgi:hypothetical protein
MAKKIDVGGELNSTALDKKLVDAAQVKDVTRDDKTQKQINDELEGVLEAHVLALEIDNTTGDIVATTGEQSVIEDLTVDSTTGEVYFNLEYK